MNDVTAGAEPIRALLIAGPTASGKSALALEIAEKAGGEIVNADSMQLYKDLRILTARPSEADEARVPHHLYGVREGGDPGSAADWAREAAAVIRDIAGRGRLPVVVGGTGLYFKALTKGLSEIPPIPEMNREAARTFVEEVGPADAHAYLAERDPETAAGLRPSDPQRIARAIEVWAATGRGLAAWQRDEKRPALQADYLKYVLLPDRADLHKRADARFDAMMAAGALEEVRALMAKGLDPSLPVMKSLGVPSLMAHLRGEMTLEDAVEAGKTQTRRYIKRQTTWIRSQMIAWKMIDAQYLERETQEILNLLAGSG